MVNVSNGALVERKTEENEERALDALEAAIAALAKEMKALRRATDRFGARMSTAVSKTEQIRSSCTALSSSMVEISNSLHSLEQTTNRLVNSSLPVAPSTMASHHRHVPLPVIPSITGSVPPSSSIPPPSSFSTFANSSVMSKLPLDTGVLRASITEPLPTLTRTEKPPSPEFPAFQCEELPPPLLLKSRPQTPFHAVPNMLPSLSANSAKPPFTPILQNCLTPHSPSPELPTPNSNTALMVLSLREKRRKNISLTISLSISLPILSLVCSSLPPSRSVILSRSASFFPSPHPNPAPTTESSARTPLSGYSNRHRR